MDASSWIFAIGIVVAAVSYLLKTFTVEPLVRYRATVGRIGNALTFYADAIYNKPNPLSPIAMTRNEEAYFALRRASADLAEAHNAIGLLPLLAALRVVPARPTIYTTRGSLMAISNSVGNEKQDIQNHERIEQINKVLGFG